MSKGALIKRPINEEIENKKSRLNLLDSDKKAYSENINDALQDCKKRVQELRKGNSKFRKQLFEKIKSDEHIINQAFQRNSIEKSMFANKTSSSALEIMNYKVCDKAKQLNFLKYLTVLKNIHFKGLNNHFDNINFEVEYVRDTITGVNKGGQEMRNLENRLDKAVLKCCEAQEINKVYIQIKYKLQEEHLHYGNNLDDIENEITYCNNDLCQIKVLYKDAIMARDLSIKELKYKEDKLFQERKRREKELICMKKAADDKQGVLEKIEKKLATRDSNIQVEEELLTNFNINERDQLKIVKFEDHYRRFQDISGVLNIQEAVLRYKNQNNTEVHLRNIIDELEKQCIKFRKEEERYLNKSFSYKFENETKISVNEDTHSNTEDYLKLQDQKNIELKKYLNKSNAILALCKLSAEHLDEILPSYDSNLVESVKKSNGNDFIVELLEKCHSNIILLFNQISEWKSTKNKQNLFHQPILETYSEFQTNVLKDISINNTRISIRKSAKDNYNGEDDPESAEDDNVIPNRNKIKKQAYLFVESKLKKKNPKKKKKTKDK